MIHDVLSMSAGIREDYRRRTIYVTFDRRIRHESVIDFANEAFSNLIKNKLEGPESAELAPRSPEKTPPSVVSKTLSWGTEREKACTIANKGLALCDAGTLDPDSDRAVLCRQYGRAIEKISRLSKILAGILAESDERNSPIRGYTIGDLNREALDHWPESPDPKIELVAEPGPESFSTDESPLPTVPKGSTVLLIMPRNVGRIPSAPRGHSAIYAKADIVAEWYSGRWNVIKDITR